MWTADTWWHATCINDVIVLSRFILHRFIIGFPARRMMSPSMAAGDFTRACLKTYKFLSTLTEGRKQ